ncbi:Ceramidase [Shimia sp. SK013]|uniref:ceramidase domain-containing protein n=1 Tax=Shimia sp. SK013 TaxID=1389006 RepID=UPI0006B4C38C|nr:ceramidase domain-containing protein [Shimia sp. SK013]KPA20891.1 Ceramidase [Shimia sp. SK013]
MDWTRYIDAYCERSGPEYWAEPVNAVTNAAFVIAALIMWRRVQGPGLGLARALCVILGLIGVGSFLFHTHAVVWAAVADTTPIAAYVLLYIFAANRDYWGLSNVWAFGATLLFFPFAYLTMPMFEALPVLGVSAGYLPVPAMIALYAVALRKRLPEVSKGLAIGVVILMVSLMMRSLDARVCEAVPLGTRFLWHILNAVMLGWMIEVYRRHVVGQKS